MNQSPGVTSAVPRRFNKKDALAVFRSGPNGVLRGEARLEAWRKYVEHLFSTGQISDKQREMWHLPT